jgi:hypothetical protein
MVAMMSDESVLKKYLLGDLPPEERVRVEHDYFADPEHFEELVGVENDLIDSYVRGTLSDSQRQQFEQHYANRPERRTRIDFAMALSQAAQQQRESIAARTASPWSSLRSYFRIQPPQLQRALVSTALLLIGVLLWLQNYRLRRDLQMAQVTTNELRLQQDLLRKQIEQIGALGQKAPQSDLESQVTQIEPPADLTLRLNAVVRGSGASQGDLVIPENRPWIRLEMVLERDEFRTYDAVVMPPEQDREILRGRALSGHSIGGSAVVSWRFQSYLIQSGDYVVKLRGQTAAGKLEDVHSYSFRVARK